MFRIVKENFIRSIPRYKTYIKSGHVLLLRRESNFQTNRISITIIPHTLYYKMLTKRVNDGPVDTKEINRKR